MDRNSLLQKCVVVGVILLFIGTSLFPSAAHKTKTPSLSNGKWLYVGGGGPGNYTKIQDAINNASDGDTVYVYHGTYNYYPPSSPSIYIPKGINLIGENKFNTTIIGISYIDTLDVGANDVCISGFTIRNSGEPWGELGAAITLWYGHRNIHIFDMIFTDNYYGILIYDSLNDVFIHDNLMSGNYIGIQSTEGVSTSVQIYHNTFSNNTVAGLSVSFHNSSIYNNNIFNNSIGVVLTGGDDACLLSSNLIQDNNIGIQVITARYKIQQNNFILNKRQAAIQKSLRLIEIPLLPFYRQKWDNNYWDDWTTSLSRPITGLGIITFRYIVPNAYVDIPIAFFLFVEVDRHPAQEPFDIPGVS